ncbi:conjugal transfer protein, partial [Bifidobacterium longum]|uniref:conjugal transfer protein n=1 Tax=Bifidobacterium longum TaxID=216816 RepID=UPI001C4DF578
PASGRRDATSTCQGSVRTYSQRTDHRHGDGRRPKCAKTRALPKTPEADASVDADTVNDATAFLETFFKLYPTATEKELAYYVAGNVIEPIGRDYLYSELVNPIFTKNGDNVKVKVAVKFLDNQTKATQVSQYELVLQKDSNWKIVG